MEHYVHAAVIGDELRSGAAPEVLARPRGRTAHGVLTAGTPGWLSAPPALVTLVSAAVSAWSFLRARLRHWQLDELANTADLAGSEPLTHALTATGVPAHASCARLYDAALDPGEPGNWEERWPLGVVASISRRWGDRTETGGKVIWREISPRPPVSDRTEPSCAGRRACAATAGAR